jgi:hypothetical protein
MDDDKNDKSIIEKTIETVKNIATNASEAAKKAMEPEPIKSGDEVFLVPMASDTYADPVMPPFVVIPRRKKSTSNRTPKKTAKKSAKKPAQRTANKPSAKKKKKTAKAGKPTANVVAKKKTAEKVAKKKKAKKSRR